jgi:hypothetical protein
MTVPFGGGGGHPALPNLPTPPSGWPVGSFVTYAEAQRAVDHLADRAFPVEDVTIVGVDLMLVERVLGRLTWGRVLASGAASGVWMGLFVGALLAYFQGNAGALIVGLVAGVLFSMLFAALGYAVQRGRRDFTSASQLVAGRYDVLCQPRNAERAKEMLGELDVGLGSAR